MYATLGTVQAIVTVEKLVTVDSILVAATGTVGPTWRIRKSAYNQGHKSEELATH